MRAQQLVSGRYCEGGCNLLLPAGFPACLEAMWLPLDNAIDSPASHGAICACRTPCRQRPVHRLGCLLCCALGDRYQLRYQPCLHKHLRAAVQCGASKRWPGCAQSGVPPASALFVQACQQGATQAVQHKTHQLLPSIPASQGCFCALCAAFAMGRGSMRWVTACAPQGSDTKDSQTIMLTTELDQSMRSSLLSSQALLAAASL